MRLQSNHSAVALSLSVEFIHVIVEQKLNSLLSCRSLKTAHKECSAGAGRAFRGLTFEPERMVLAPSAEPNGMCTAVVGRLIHKRHAVGKQEFERRGHIKSERVLHSTVVIAIVRHAARLNDRPVCQILKNQFRRIFNTVLFLERSASAQRHIAARRNGMTADIVISVNNKHRKTCITCADCSGKSYSPRPDDYNVGFVIPFLRHRSTARSSRCGSGAGQSCHSGKSRANQYVAA